MIAFSYVHILSVITAILTLIFAAQILRVRRPAGATTAWLLAIIFIPYVGIPFYLIFGGRKLRRDAKKKGTIYAPVPFSQTPEEVATLERILLSSGVPPKSVGNKVILLETGENSFQGMVDAIEAAKKSISITTFVFRGDETGRLVSEALAAKAREGVKVRVLIDGFLMPPWGIHFLNPLKEAGGEVAIFNPMIHFPFRGHANLRNHRKMMIVDGVLAIFGGMNIAKEYMGPRPDSNRWVDLSLRVEGPVVSSIDAIFCEDWRFVTKEKVSATKENQQSPGTTALQVVPSGPDVAGDPLYDSIVSAIFSAKKRVWVATPYFIPDETLARALELAVRRGVDLRLVVPKRSNHLLADLCRRSYLRQLHEAGGKIYFYKAGMMHGKVTLIDNDCALVGSANMDMRSLLFNYEIGVFLYSPPVVEEVAVWLSHLVAQCATYPEIEPGSLWLDGLGRILGPLL